MKTFAIAAVLTVLPMLPANAASYTPFGPQTNVAVATVTGGGWTQCFAGTYNGQANLGTTLAGCTGSRLMMAARETGSSTLLLLAQAPKVDVTFFTGNHDYAVTHNANGSEWYYADDWSWGFANGGETVSKDSCDFDGTNPTPTNTGLRLCWHTDTGVIVSGYRIGDIVSFGDNYERLLYTTSVPEPTTWALMIGGFGLIGAAARRRSRLAKLAA